MFSEVIYCILLGFALLHFSVSRRRRKNFPPGPISFPVVGNMFQLGADLDKGFSGLRKRYGDIFSVDLGSLRCVVLNDYKLMREALSHPAVLGRTSSHHIEKPSGFAFSEGKLWIAQRRSFFHGLKNLGFRSKSLNDVFQREILEMLSEMRGQKGNRICTMDFIVPFVMNPLYSMMTGIRYKKDNPEFLQLRKSVKYVSEESSVFFLAFLFPWFTKYFPKQSGYSEYLQNMSTIRGIITKEVVEHKRTFRPDTTRDLIDFYLKDILETPSSKVQEARMLHNITDVTLEIVETVPMALSWIMLVLAINPESQHKLFNEISSVVGMDTLPSLDDKNSLPYTNAVLLEALRLTRFVNPVFRNSVEDFEFHGYHIEKGTTVIVNYGELLSDPEVWGDPEVFRPERFLSEDGKSIIRQEAYLMFSIGKRSCPGEHFAKDLLFLYTASLIQKFKITFDEQSPPPTTEGLVGMFIMYPKPHKLIFLERPGM